MRLLRELTSERATVARLEAELRVLNGARIGDIMRGEQTTEIDGALREIEADLREALAAPLFLAECPCGVTVDMEAGEFMEISVRQETTWGADRQPRYSHGRASFVFCGDCAARYLAAAEQTVAELPQTASAVLAAVAERKLAKRRRDR